MIQGFASMPSLTTLAAWAAKNIAADRRAVLVG
jgi:hypothetical protein